jgi:tetratricopeptide (TPR) repeat protein
MRHIAVVLVLFSSIAARAQQQPDLMALGKQEYDAGKKEFNLGHYEKALAHFETAYRLTALPELLYNLGVVQRQLFEQTRNPENLEHAIERFKAYLADPRTLQNPERRAGIEKVLAEAEERLARDKAMRAKGEEALTLGEEFLRDGRIDDAQAQVEVYLRAPGNERLGVARAARLSAAVAARHGDASAAELAWTRALELDRSAPPPVEPEARRAWDAARARLGEAPPLRIAHTPPPSAKAGARIELSFAVTNDPLGVVRGVRVSYRMAGSKAFSSLPVAPAGPIALPPAFTQAVPAGSRVEYFAVAVDANEALLEHVGSESLPFGIQIEARRGPSVAKKWWFWTSLAAAAAVVAGGVALAVTLTQPAPPIDVPFHTGLNK